MRFTCIDFLPQSYDVLVKDCKMKVSVLKLLDFVVRELILAIENFYIYKNYTCFDPHVGETSCQVRALQMLVVARNAEYSFSTSQQRIASLKATRQVIAGKIGDISASRHGANNSQTLLEFLKEQECLFVINREERFLMPAFYLTQFKYAVNENETYICIDSICAESGLARKQVKKLTHFYQGCMARYSCLDILNWTQKLYDLPMAEMHLAQMMKKDDDGRSVLPQYYAAEVLLSYIELERLPIFIVAKRTDGTRSELTSMLFVKDKHSRQFRLENSNLSEYLYHPCFVVHGGAQYHPGEFENQEQYSKRFMDIGIKKILLLNMASHPQYSGKHLSQYRADPFQVNFTGDEALDVVRQRFNNMRDVAQMMGCSVDNQQLFFINHTFCDTLHKQLMKLQSGPAEQSIARNFDAGKEIYGQETV